MPKSVTKKPRSITVTVDGEEFEADEIDIPADLNEQLIEIRRRLGEVEESIGHLTRIAFRGHP